MLLRNAPHSRCREDLVVGLMLCCCQCLGSWLAAAGRGADRLLFLRGLSRRRGGIIGDFNLNESSADETNIIALVIDALDHTVVGRGDLGDQLVGEHLADVVVLSSHELDRSLTSLIFWPSLTNHSLMVASFVPSPKSGRFIRTNLANQRIIAFV